MCPKQSVGRVVRGVPPRRRGSRAACRAARREAAPSRRHPLPLPVASPCRSAPIARNRAIAHPPSPLPAARPSRHSPLPSRCLTPPARPHRAHPLAISTPRAHALAATLALPAHRARLPPPALTHPPAFAPAPPCSPPIAHIPPRSFHRCADVHRAPPLCRLHPHPAGHSRPSSAARPAIRPEKNNSRFLASSFGYTLPTLQFSARQKKKTSCFSPRFNYLLPIKANLSVIDEHVPL